MPPLDASPVVRDNNKHRVMKARHARGHTVLLPSAFLIQWSKQDNLSKWISSVTLPYTTLQNLVFD